MGNFVLVGEGFKIKVYENDHPKPHCHLIRNDESVTILNLPSLSVRHGAALSRKERQFVIENLEEICEAFDNRTPKRENSHETE